MTRGFIYNTITKRGLYKSTNFPLKNKINKDFNLKNTNLFFGFRKKILSLHQKSITNDMRIQESKYLSSLAKEANMTEKQLSKALINELVSRELICDDEANYGNWLCYSLEPDTSVSDVVGVLNSIGINDVRYKHFKCLLLMKIIGDGECPDCGGEMETIDADYRRTGGDGYLTPLEYEPLWEEKVCRNCGRKIIVEK